MTALRILHVEDEADIREVAALALGLQHNFDNRSCGSGQEAITIAGSWMPDIILMDVMMPGMDGPTTLARLRGNKQTAEIPVIFMTARAQSGELHLLRSLGAVGVIAKPFDPMTLAASVYAYLPSPHDKLGTLRRNFTQRIDKDAAALKEYRPKLTGGTLEPPAWAQMEHIAHGLAGAGGIFGFNDISDAAAELEEAIRLNRQSMGTREFVVTKLDGLIEIAKNAK